MKKTENIIIKKLTDTDNEIFFEILWTALNVPGTDRGKNIIFEPMILPYYQNWGKPDDIGFEAHSNNSIMGAIWCRLKNDVTETYPDYPELAMAVLPIFQNNGIGSCLLTNLITACKDKYTGLRLGANQKNLRAIEFYKNFGFEIFTYYNDAPQMRLVF